jgi:hypothetical protein
MFKTLWYKLKGWWNDWVVVRPRWLKNDLYADCDELLEYACFEILCRFVEEELVPMHHYNDKVYPYGKEDAKLIALYDWWTNIYLIAYPKERNALLDEAIKIKDKGMHNETYIQILRLINKQDEAQRKTLTAKLHQLINLRGCMWT